MNVSIIAGYVLPLVVIWFVLWARVASNRALLSVSIGDGGNMELLERIRAHGNFIEWVPWVLILMLIAELCDGPDMLVHASGALLVLGRLVHPFGLKADNAKHPLRIVGNSLNILSLIAATAAIAIGFTQAGA